MKLKTDDILIYKDWKIARRYGTGIVTSLTPNEYARLWSGRGLTKYKRSILDDRLEQTFQPVADQAGFPKERHLQLGEAKVRVTFNENYDRARLALLCEKLRLSAVRKEQDVADGLATQLFTTKLALRGS